MKRILIVDDSAFLRRILKGHLSVERLRGLFTGDCVWTEAGTKAEALQKAQQERPDLILLDIVMDEGERDGIEILDAIMRGGWGCKVIMMSAVGQEPIIRECLAKGASGYVLKPFDEEQVFAMIETVMATPSETVEVSAPA